MARIKALDDGQVYWYSERGAGPSYVWTDDESQATDMPRIYANARLEELRRVERWRERNEQRDIQICRSKLQ